MSKRSISPEPRSDLSDHYVRKKKTIPWGHISKDPNDHPWRRRFNFTRRDHWLLTDDARQKRMWINDIIINSLLTLVPEMSPLRRHMLVQPVQRSIRLTFLRSSGPIPRFIQILHISDDHWVTATNWFTENHIPEGRAAAVVYDTLGGDRISDMVKLQVSRLVPYTGGVSFVLHQKPIQYQKRTECGMYALAFAVSIMLGRDPARENHFIEDQMREHYLAMLSGQIKKLTMFPQYPQETMSRKVPSVVTLVRQICSCQSADFDPTKLTEVERNNMMQALSVDNPVDLTYTVQCFNRQCPFPGRWWHPKCTDPVKYNQKQLIFHCPNCPQTPASSMAGSIAGSK
jgi:hypothetical protein